MSSAALLLRRPTPWRPAIRPSAYTPASTSIASRSCAQLASAPPPSFTAGQAKQHEQPPWKPKPVLATAQTLTLFSESPQGLLIALRSTLQGMTDLASRFAPLSTAADQASAPSATAAAKRHDHLLLYSLSKDLPLQHLAQAVSLLRGTDPSLAKQRDAHPATPPPRIARVGLLSSPLPSSLIPPNALEPGAPPIASSTLHSVSLSLLPGVNAVPFRSEIPGRAQVAVGRWPDRKPSWQQGAERGADLLGDVPSSSSASSGAISGSSGSAAADQTTAAATDSAEAHGEARDWRDIWGRENISSAVPPALQGLDPASVLSLLFFTDPCPQGLTEGLASRFPYSSVLGLHAPPTPFETGRDQTLLVNLPGDGSEAAQLDKIHSDGAVGVALVANVDAKGRKAGKEMARPSVEVSYEGLVPFGPRREVTSASGNIVTELDQQNAAQQFLRDIQKRSSHSSPSAPSSSSSLSASETREIASKVKKEEAFYIALFSSPTSSEPLMISPILSGHPARGTLSVETDVDLGPGPRGQQGSMRIFAQFFQHSPDSLSREGEVESIQIPGEDVSAWTSPRYLFLSSPCFASNFTATREETVEKERGKHQVFALPNLFIAASEKGWIVGRGKKLQKVEATKKVNEEDEQQGGSVALKRDGSSIVECRVPKARVVLNLRGE